MAPPTASPAEQLASLDPTLRERLDARGFDAARWLAWGARIGGDPRARNAVQGAVTTLAPEALVTPPAPDDPRHAELVALGEAALRRGEVAIAVLAGGMATRMGGVVKALVEALPGERFIDLRLAERRRLTEAYGAEPPMWLMTSEPTHEPIREALGEALDGEQLAVFPQNVALRFDPEGGLFQNEDGPSVYATGHGDFPDALAASGLLERFVARGGRHVWISNLDNLGVTVDPLLLGLHIDGARTLSVEVVDKRPGDTGGGPVNVDGAPVIVEHFRLPEGFDADTVPVFNTNTFLADAAALAALELEWTFLEVHKKVGDATAVQFERLLGEITFAMPSTYVRVPRGGAATRFLPLKTRDDLERERDAIESVAAARLRPPPASG